MNAEILSIGDELLIGQVANTNASYLGEQLSILGIAVRRVTTVGDRADDLLAAFARAWEDQDIVLATGGLGPTHDDVTRDAVCRFFGTGLVESAEALADVERFLAERNRPVTATNRDQAMVPAAAEVIRNRNGTAPGYHFQRDGKHFFVTPGVPFEMQGMMERYILPLLRELSGSTRTTVTLLTTGIPESTLADALAGIEKMGEDCTVAYLPSALGVRVRLTAVAQDAALTTDRVGRLRAFVEERAGEYVYGTGTATLEAVVGAMLAARGHTLAVAESCTGGHLADRITNAAGSSQYFMRGAVCYSNRSKQDVLGVDPALIAAHGAVSRQTAEAMAEGIRRTTGTSFGLSTTGVAGPAGGSAAKPVGLVWIGISSDAGTFARDFHFGNDRMRTKQRAAQAALDMLRRAMSQLPLQPTFLRSGT